jgi:hypothetical protein
MERPCLHTIPLSARLGLWPQRDMGAGHDHSEKHHDDDSGKYPHGNGKAGIGIPLEKMDHLGLL